MDARDHEKPRPEPLSGRPVEPAARDDVRPDHVRRDDVRRDDVRVSASLVRCPFCHDAIAPERTDWVACRACLARHHDACWSESGKCATCGGTRALGARAKVPPVAVFLVAFACMAVASIAFGLLRTSERAPALSKTEERIAQPAPPETPDEATPAPRPDERPGGPFAVRREAPIFERAHELERRGDFLGAIAEYDRIERSLRESALQRRFYADALFDRALVELELGRTTHASGDLTTILALDRGDAAAYVLRAAASESEGELDAALGDLRKAFEIVDDDAKGEWLEREIERLERARHPLPTETPRPR